MTYSANRLTPFQRDYQRMIDTLGIELARVGAADEALVRRIALPDTGRQENDHIDCSGTSDPTGNEVERRCDAQEQREQYRDIAVSAIWSAIKAAKWATDDVLRNEPIKPHGGQVCATKDCTRYASPHTRPDTGDVIPDLCDDCWTQLCQVCYLRPVAEYRATCFACYQRELRRGAA